MNDTQLKQKRRQPNNRSFVADGEVNAMLNRAQADAKARGERFNISKLVNDALRRYWPEVVKERASSLRKLADELENSLKDSRHSS